MSSINLTVSFHFIFYHHKIWPFIVNVPERGTLIKSGTFSKIIFQKYLHNNYHKLFRLNITLSIVHNYIYLLVVVL